MLANVVVHFIQKLNVFAVSKMHHGFKRNFLDLIMQENWPENLVYTQLMLSLIFCLINSIQPFFIDPNCLPDILPMYLLIFCLLCNLLSIGKNTIFVFLLCFVEILLEILILISLESVYLQAILENLLPTRGMYKILLIGNSMQMGSCIMLSMGILKWNFLFNFNCKLKNI